MTQREAVQWLLENQAQLRIDIKAAVPQAINAMLAAIIFSESPDQQGEYHTINHHLYFTDAVKRYAQYHTASQALPGDPT